MDDTLYLDSSTFPINQPPALTIAGAMEISLLKTVTKKTGLNVLYNVFFEPTQLRVSNFSNQDIYFAILTESGKQEELAYPGNAGFIKLASNGIASNDITRGKYLYLYSGASATGIIEVNLLSFWSFEQEYVI